MSKKKSRNKKSSQNQTNATMTSWYCATWESCGNRYYSDPNTGERKLASEDLGRMRLMIGDNGDPDLDDVSLDKQLAKVDKKLAGVIPGIPLKLSQSELFALLRRKK